MLWHNGSDHFQVAAHGVTYGTQPWSERHIFVQLVATASTVLNRKGMLVTTKDTAVHSPEAGIDHRLVDRAKGLFELLRAEAQEGQKKRQITPPATEAMSAEGVFQLMVPTRLGGRGSNAQTLTEVLIELGRADGSAGWSAALVNACTWFCVTYGEHAQREIWGDNPDAKACGIFFPGMTKKVGGTEDVKQFERFVTRSV